MRRLLRTLLTTVSIVVAIASGYVFALLGYLLPWARGRGADADF